MTTTLLKKISDDLHDLRARSKPRFASWEIGLIVVGAVVGAFFNEICLGAITGMISLSAVSVYGGRGDPKWIQAIRGGGFVLQLVLLACLIAIDVKLGALLAP